MSSASAKKPPSSGVNRVSSTEPGSSPSSSPSRNTHRSTPSIGGAGAGSVARSRSTRSGTPVSARAAAQRKESSLNNTTEADEAARAESVALMDDLKDRLSKAEASSEQYRKQAEVLQTRLDEAIQESTKLEEKSHEAEEQIETLRNEKRDVARQLREMEAIYEAERSSMTKEKEDMSTREEEMQMVIQRLKDSLAQRNNHSSNGEEETRSSRQSHSPSVEGGFAPPASLNRSDSRNNSKLLLQKDKLIESLRLELAEAQIKLVESENSGGGRLQEVEKLLMEARMANARLMEDNESYQLLLQERTLNGDFAKSDFSYMEAGVRGGGSRGGSGGGGGGGTSANQDALNALEGRGDGDDAGGTPGGASLADELSEAADNETEGYRRLETELKAAKDQNKALTLYINKIIERLLQHQDFEHILDQSGDVNIPPPANTNKELPPAPSEKPAAVGSAASGGSSFLQRAKSMAVGPGKPRPRPVSVMPGPSAHEDPETAPRIPIGNLNRASSTRRPSRPVSEQFTGAASLVNQMYRGHDGPASPPIGNPRLSQSFFMGGAGAGGPSSPAAARIPSGASNQQQQQQQQTSSGNFPGMRSETSSTSGDGDVVSTASSSQTSPPRGTHPDKQTTLAGNKPRPLRLLQESEPKPTETANKRASWMGWASGWGQKKDAAGTPEVATPPEQQQQQQTSSPPPTATIQENSIPE